MDGPEAKNGASPLLAALREKAPVWRHPEEDMARYSASSLGISPEKFAYFALSLVWRAAACKWPLPDGSRTTPLDLEEFFEPMRTFLVGESAFPSQTFIMLTVCTDEKSREYWSPPQRSVEAPSMVVVPINGLLFRVWLGNLPTDHRLQKMVFFPVATDDCVFTTHCWNDVLSVVFSRLFPTAGAS